MVSLTENEEVSVTYSSPIWRLAFRSFFLGGSLFSIIAIGLWWLIREGLLTLPVYGNWLWWHAHEMIFGFASAIVVGFLLTAVQTWTGIRGFQGKPLAGLFVLWASARLSMFLPIPVTLVALLDVSFPVVVALVLAKPLLKTHNVRNAVFVLFLLLLAVLNLSSHIAVAKNTDFLRYFHATVFLFVLIVTVMGGRVIPAFTANALKIKANKPLKWIEWAVIFSGALMLGISLIGFSRTPDWLLMCIAAVAFTAHSLRMSRWFNPGIRSRPILWSLHLAYSFLPLGFIFLLLQGFAGVNLSIVFHSFTVGGIGGLILAMISRVSLGHTGRSLILPKLMTAALYAFFIGAYVRTLLPALSTQFHPIAITIATLCWITAFSLFLISYTPILTSD